MIAKKIKYRLRRAQDYINAQLGRLNLGIIVGSFFYILLIGVLAINAYNAYTKGISNLQKYDEELIVTNNLIAENDGLRSLYNYYNSIDYKKIYARDNLNLGERDETFYYIERPEELDIDRKVEKKEIRVVSNISLWTKLIFGV